MSLLLGPEIPVKLQPRKTRIAPEIMKHTGYSHLDMVLEFWGMEALSIYYAI